MPNIFLIDDDVAADSLAEYLECRGHSVTRIRTIGHAMESMAEILAADLIVLDLLMPLGTFQDSEFKAIRATGMRVYKEIRKLSKSLKIVIYTADQDAAIAEIIRSDKYTQLISRWSGPSLSEFLSTINRMLGIEDAEPQMQVFIVHGHDDTAKLSLKNYLQNSLKLPEPTILHEQPNCGRTIIEKFEDLSREADLVFVLLTPDDPTAAGSDSDAKKRRARQNVIFELGYFIGLLGRRSGRVFLLYKGDLELPSDISGLVYLNIDHGIESVGEQIRREIDSLKNRRGLNV